MTDRDDDAGDRSIVVPRPRRSGGPVRLVGRRDAVTPPARSCSATAVLDVVAPPWLRSPAVGADVPARPVVLRVVAEDPQPVVAADRSRDQPAPFPAGPRNPPPAPRAAAMPVPPPHPARARPPVVPEPGILGLSRLTRGRVGSRLFTLFFVAVFAVILVQMVMAILYG